MLTKEITTFFFIESLELGVEEYTSTCSVCSKEIHYDVADVEKRLSVALEFFDKGTELRDQGKII